MTLPATGFLETLEQTAIAAQAAEIEFRRSMASMLASHERKRKFAFRRVTLATAMARAAEGQESEEAAIAAQLSALRRELGWHADTANRQRVMEAATPIALAIWNEVRPDVEDEEPAPNARASVPDAFAVFEAWYEEAFGAPFLAMLEQEIPEMALVEF